MRILGIETSADETGISLIEASGTGAEVHFKVLGNALLSQAELHSRYGGIFPNLAKREHGRNLVPVLMECLRQADGLKSMPRGENEMHMDSLKQLLIREEELYTYLSQFFRSYDAPDIDAIAVTAGPGLEPALWVGINFAKALAQVWKKPLIAVNHLEGHIMVARAKGDVLAPIEFPAMALLVSGGHTELVYMKEWMNYTMIGQTRDDAAGEAFDKSARLLGLPYPGGPEISKLAHQAREANTERHFELPRPMMLDESYDFSFSGLKTAVKRIIENITDRTHEMNSALAREAEEAIVDVLLAKTKRAVEEYSVKTLIVGGGVSANDHLRRRFADEFKDHGIHLLFPSPELSTDNGIMIALAGYFHAEKQQFIDPAELSANGNLRIA